MRRNISVALASLGLLLGLAGCNSFLTGDKLSSDPNNPSLATIQTLLVGIQAGQFAFHEGTAAMMVCEWMQQCGATNGRYVEQAGRYVFGAGSNIGANGTDWASVYTGGGLIDMDTIASMARAAGDDLYLGIDLVWKAYTVGSAADLWGSIPYSEIRGGTAPVLDSQLVVYDTVQNMLNRGIVALKSGVTTLPAPPDLVLGADPKKWVAVAHTLKARYFLHTVEAASTGKLGGRTAAAVWADVIAQADSGISDRTGASDLRAFHSGAGYPQSNQWFTFQDNSAFGGDLEAGKALVDYMNTRGDPRRADYFCPLVDATWTATHAYKLGDQIGDSNGNIDTVSVAGTSGAAEPTWSTTVGGTTTDGPVTWVNIGPNYAGDDFNVPQTSVSNFQCEPTRFSAKFSVPYVTYQENQLILAEANLAVANVASAQAHLDSAYLAVPGLASRNGGATGAALLDSIMLEKYVVMFQNFEALSDYRRTCIAGTVQAGVLVPIKYVQPNVLGLAAVPGELFYPQTERNANSHIPTESQEVTAQVRTQSDVNACPTAYP